MTSLSPPSPSHIAFSVHIMNTKGHLSVSEMFQGMNQADPFQSPWQSDESTEGWSLNTERHSTDRGPLPGDIVWWASRDAGFKGVGAIHAHCVKSLVVTETKGIEVDVGLGSSSGARLTWKQTHANLKKKEKGPQSWRTLLPPLFYEGMLELYQSVSLHPGQQFAQMASSLDHKAPPPWDAFRGSVEGGGGKKCPNGRALKLINETKGLQTAKSTPPSDRHSHSSKMSSWVGGGMLRAWLCKSLKGRLTLSEYRKKHTKRPRYHLPMQQTHPSDEPDQRTKGTEGPDTCASVWKSRSLPTQGNGRNEILKTKQKS